MPGRFLLDTNAVIALFARQEGAIAKIQRAREVVVPAVVMGRRYYARGPGRRLNRHSIQGAGRADL